MTESSVLERLRAVTQGELRAMARQKTPFVLRGLYAVLVAIGVVSAGGTLYRLSAAQGWSGESMARLGANTFAVIVVVQSILATLLGVLLAISSIYAERQNKTLGLLVLSQLRSSEIVFGKFLAIFGLVVSVLLAGLPVFALLGWVGGVDYDWLPTLALYTLILAGLGTATGLFFSLKFHSAAGAAAASIGLLCCPVLLAIPYLNPRAGGCGCFGGLLWLPAQIVLGVGAMAKQAQGATPSVFVGTVFSLFMISFLLAASNRALVQTVSADQGTGLRGLFERLDAFFEEINFGGVRFDLGGRGSPRGNPVTWLTRTSSGLGLPHYGLRVIAAAIMISLAGLVLATEGPLWGQMLIGFWFLAALGVPMTAGAMAFGDERVRRTLGVLLATPLTSATILRGKLYVFLRLLVLLVIPAAFFMSLMKKVDAYGADELISLSYLLLAEAFLAYFSTLFFSIVLPGPLRASAASVATLITLHGLYSLAWLSTVSADPAWVFVRPILLGWSCLFGLLGLAGARLRADRPALGLILMLAGLAPALGLLPQHPYRPEVELTAIALFIFIYTIFSFDRALGRTP